MGGIKILLILVALLFIASFVVLGWRSAVPATVTSPAIVPPATAQAEGDLRGFLHGRVATEGGATYEGRLRWGGDEEAFWSDYFNGFKDQNPWVEYVPIERLPKVRRSIRVLGLWIGEREGEVDVGRPFMARFGDVARIEALGQDVRVTLKSGAAFDLDRLSAGDFDDGVRVWDARHGVVDLGPRQIRTIELFGADRPGSAPARLHGTVRTRQGDFTGFLQWNRRECVGSDELDGQGEDGELSVRFDAIRSIARHSGESSRVTLWGGREIVLSGTREAGDGNRGIYVDDRRYGRVLVSWDAFERVEFSAAGGNGGLAYDDFPPGRQLTGSVTTRDGRRLAGRLVYDLDESETTETLDAPSKGVDYTIPFGLIASMVPPGREERGARLARLTLHDGEELRLEPDGDLGEGNAGMLIFADGRRRPEYLPWSDVERVDFDRPPVSARHPDGH